MIRYRKAIINLLTNKYYSTTDNTVYCPENIYDPYLVEYLQNKIGIKDSRRHICQLGNPYVHDFSNTVWQTLLYQDVSLLQLTKYTLHLYKFYLFDTNFSNVDNYRLTSMVDPTHPFDELRLVPAKFQETDLVFRTVNYIFSDRFYYFLLHSFESGTVIDDIIPLLDAIDNDDRIAENLDAQFFSFSDFAYHDMAFYDTHSKVTGSNNDAHLPEVEYLIVDYILNDRIDLEYLLEKVLVKFPFDQMTHRDRLYYSALFLHLIDVSISNLR